MDITVFPGTLSGKLSVIPSKSIAHRYLICAALSDAPTEITCPETSTDIESTVCCLNALGAKIVRSETGYTVYPIAEVPKNAVLPCGESGATLRFLLPIVGALGIDGTFLLEGRLPKRPLSPLWEEMERMGCSLSRPSHDHVHCTGKLQPGTYCIDGGVSSQFLTGLLFGLSLIDGESSLEITGRIESKPYLDMTRAVMDVFHGPHYHSPGKIAVEGDWSNGAFWLAATALGSAVEVTNLRPDSVQGDRAALELLLSLKQHHVIDASDIPDLVPILAVTAAVNRGAVFTHVQRLRLKESDRIESTVSMINRLGGKAMATDDTLTIHGTGLIGGTVDSRKDHRIAMAAAIGATACRKPVTILDAHCVSKSYPTFWDEYAKLGGKYEQHLR